MNERDFIYWLSGFLESSNVKTLSEEQLATVKDHLKLAVNKVTPNNYGITLSPNQGIIANPLNFPSTEIIC